MEFESARCPSTGVTYDFEPPVYIEYREMPSLPFDDVTDVFAALLVGKRGLEAVQKEARRLYVMSQVAPNPQVFARQLTELTGGKYTATVR